MDTKTASAIASHIGPEEAKHFVTAAFNVIKAALIVREQEREARTPGTVDYGSAELDRSTPADGWITDETLLSYQQRMTEAIAAEKWMDGFIFAIQLISVLRP